MSDSKEYRFSVLVEVFVNAKDHDTASDVVSRRFGMVEPGDGFVDWNYIDPFDNGGITCLDEDYNPDAWMDEETQ